MVICELHQYNDQVLNVNYNNKNPFVMLLLH